MFSEAPVENGAPGKYMMHSENLVERIMENVHSPLIIT